MELLDGLIDITVVSGVLQLLSFLIETFEVDLLGAVSYTLEKGLRNAFIHLSTLLRGARGKFNHISISLTSAMLSMMQVWIWHLCLAPS